MIYPKKDGGYEIDATIDASLYGMFAFGVYDPFDVKVQNTMKAIEDALWVKTKIGGIARYENDGYQRVGNDGTIPGNPWIICTMWLAQYYVSTAKWFGVRIPGYGGMLDLPPVVSSGRIYRVVAEALEAAAPQYPGRFFRAQDAKRLQEVFDSITKLTRPPALRACRACT